MLGNRPPTDRLYRDKRGHWVAQGQTCNPCESFNRAALEAMRQQADANDRRRLRIRPDYV